MKVQDGNTLIQVERLGGNFCILVTVETQCRMYRIPHKDCVVDYVSVGSLSPYIEFTTPSKSISISKPDDIKSTDFANIARTIIFDRLKNKKGASK